MRTESEVSPVQVVEAWLNGTDPRSPAGPLFAGGRYAPSEITMNSRAYTHLCGTGCTSSPTRVCC
jgi:hypothetical protein